MTDDAGQPGPTPVARRRRVPLLWTVIAAVLVLGGGIALVAGLMGSGGTPTPPGITATAGSTGQAGSGDAPQTSSEPTATDDAAPAGEGAGETTEAAAVAEPVSVSIPSIGVTSDLLHLGLDAEGALEVPQGDDFDTAAWYDGSPRPGQDGPAVLLGHVSSVDRGPSVFFDLATLDVGDTIEVTREDGTTATFEVYDLQQFPKDSFPTVQVYGQTEGPELRLITCAGTIVESTTHLSDNVIVFARQA